MWKPYDEEKPGLDDMYIVAWRPKGHYITMEHFYALWEFVVEADEFIIEGPAVDVWKDYEIEILAWTELPEAYKE